jgi:glycosyltransferase involved in cell wall biosynthesis
LVGRDKTKNEAIALDVSVVIATYNRAYLLKETLDTLGLQQYPDSLAWEIVVVDNNSRDSTPAVVDAFAKTSRVPVRYEFEPRQGQSNARNHGIQAATGTVIAFTDDDVLPARDWVAGVKAAIDRWNADGVGGRILPHWEVAPPRWLAQNHRLLGHLALMDFDQSQLLTFPTKIWPEVWGANMAFRRDLFDRVGVFDPQRGMVGTKLFRGEEVELVNRALEQGLRIAYDANLTVSHRVGRERMRRAYFRKLFFDIAEGEVRFRPAVVGRTFRGAPLWWYRVLFADLWKCLLARLFRGPDAFDQQLEWFALAGRISGYWKLHKASHRG